MKLQNGLNKRINAGSVTTDLDLAYPMTIEVMPLAILIEQQNRIDQEEKALLRLLVELLLAELRRPVRSTTEEEAWIRALARIRALIKWARGHKKHTIQNLVKCIGMTKLELSLEELCEKVETWTADVQQELSAEMAKCMVDILVSSMLRALRAMSNTSDKFYDVLVCEALYEERDTTRLEDVLCRYLQDRSEFLI